jgi:hypothetical protein
MDKNISIWIIIISNDYLIYKIEIYLIDNLKILIGNCENNNIDELLFKYFKNLERFNCDIFNMVLFYLWWMGN